jgi:hypothetical protein
MHGLGTSLIESGRKVPTSRIVLALLATAAAIYMYGQAHADGVAIVQHGVFGPDFRGTIWLADRAILHGLSPYPDPSKPIVGLPAVYLPPIFLATLPLGWLPFHVATWIWFGALVAAAVGILAVLGVRDPWCYALFVLSLPVEQSLALGNASIFVALGVALAWRFRDHPLLGPLALAATMTVKFFVWPLLVWLLIVRPRAAASTAIMFAGLTLAAWAAIGFRGFLDYPALMHAEGSHFAYAGVLFVPALIQLHLRVRLAAGVGILGSLALLGLAWARRSSELEVFTLALLASLVATTVAWPHYLVLMALPIVILYPRIALAWAWFPALWVATHLGAKPGEFGYSLIFCIFAILPAVVVLVSRRTARGASEVFA